MAKNKVQEGRVVTVTAPATIVSGQAVKVGELFGIALHDAANGAALDIEVEGVWDRPKAASQAWTVGALVYWNPIAANCTTVPTGNLLIGQAAAAVGSGAEETTGRVLLARHAVASMPAPAWSIAGASEVTEGNAANYTISYADVALVAPATIAVATVDGAAQAGVAYTALSTVLTFTQGGVTQKTLAVLTIEDTAVEGTEDFTVTISAQSVGTIDAGEVSTDIVDDDA